MTIITKHRLKFKRKRELELAKTDEAYHRKQMEYYQERIKILKGDKK